MGHLEGFLKFCQNFVRETFGGLSKKYNVEPDMAMYGKALGNGYAITAVVGKKSVMEAAQSTFISSTFWTERIGPTAALKTLEIMEKIKSWEIITEIGNKVRNGWIELARSYKLEITISGIPSISTYSFNTKNSLAYKTLITQEMLKKGFLASTNFYACISHDDSKIDLYLNALSDVYKMISDCEKKKINITDLLEGPICHSSFGRLN